MTSIQKVVFLGSKLLGLHALNAIHGLRPDALLAVVTFNDTADPRSDLAGFRKFAEITGKPLYVAKNASDAEGIIKSLRPDLCLVVCWYWMIKDELLNAIPHGAIGVHNSLLPKYRGGSPLVWAILNGENEIGFSIFSLAHEMDAGQIWFQEKLGLPENMSVGEALANIEIKLIETLHSGWCALLDGQIKPRPQELIAATYCAQRMPEDGKINWSQSARQIINFIRAQSAPYPGAFANFNDEKVTLPEVTMWHSPYFGVPGQVARTSDAGVLIICGDNQAVVLNRVIVDGSERPAREVFTSIKIRL